LILPTQSERAAMVGAKKDSVGLVQFLFLLSVVVLCAILYAPRVFVHIPLYRSNTTTAADPSSSSSAAAGGGDGREEVVLDNQVRSLCSAMRNGTICCDRSDVNTDVCFMSGDVRTDAASLSLLLVLPPPARAGEEEERIRPYTRKWERHLMSRIQEVRLRRVRAQQHGHECDVRHDAPLLVMTAGGYTGNFFHAFSDGFLPAWVTAQHLRRRVVLGVLAYNPWWARRFSHIISGLSAYDVVDLLRDTRTHCFPGAIVGTRFHGIINVDPARLRDNKTVVDFHRFLAGVYEETPGGGDRRHRESSSEPNNKGRSTTTRRPRLGIVSRKGTRVVENQAAVAELARSVGFDVDVLETSNRTPLSAVYAAVSACDALVGVHGADLTRVLFLRPGRASLTQIAPLGVSSIARDCFGRPAARMGLHYEQYEVRGRESSLSRRYALDDAVVADPETAKRNGGWSFVSRVYLNGQNVTLDLDRFRHTLARLHAIAQREGD
jgi:hypothetical protein